MSRSGLTLPSYMNDKRLSWS